MSGINQLRKHANELTEVTGVAVNLIEEGKEHLTPVAIYHPEPEARQLRLQVRGMIATPQ